MSGLGSALGSALTSPVTLYVLVGLLFAGVLGVALQLASPLFVSASRRRLADLGQFLGTQAGTARSSAAQVSPSAVTSQLLALSDRLISESEGARTSAVLLERADLPIKANEWYVLRGLSVGVGAAGGWLLLHDGLIAASAGILLGALAGIVLPAAALRFLAARRARAFEAQLPDVLMLVATSLSSGLSLPQAIDAIVADAAQPVAKEFSRALAETRIGADLEGALERVARRMDSQNLEWTTMAIRIQRQVGGGLAETLRTTAGTLRERETLQRQVKTLSAEGRLSAAILVLLPVGMFIYMLLVNREYISLLWTDVIGWALSAVALFGLVAGIFWMRQVVKVEV